MCLSTSKTVRVQARNSKGIRNLHCNRAGYEFFGKLFLFLSDASTKTAIYAVSLLAGSPCSV